MKKVGKILSVCACFLLASSCADGSHLFDDERVHDPIDPDRKLSRQDFKDMHNLDAYAKVEGPTVTANVLEPPIPDLAEILTAPKPPKIAATQLVSVAVTDDVPLKDMLIELARLADIDIEVDAGITGGIAFRAKDRPFNEVIERIADLAGLRYKVQNNVLRVERDTPYIQTYALDMMNITRASEGTISISSGTGGGGSGGGSSGGGGSGGSSSGSGGASGSSVASITAQSTSDFWEKFSEGVANILGFQSATLVSGTTMASQPAPAGAPAAPAAPAEAPAVGNAGGGTFFSLNRQAGTLTVSATERQHDMIKRFLRAIENNISSQVLIEAKIVEVTLNDNYQTGINWTRLGSDHFSLASDLSDVTASDTDRGAATLAVIKNGFANNHIDLSAAVNMLNEFGTTRALSSPRLNAMNNQQAVLSFVENVIYFDVECSVTAAVAGTGGSPGTPAQIDVTSEDQVAPVGITMVLQPSINREANEVTLSVRPTLTKITSFVADPGYEICKAQAVAQLDDDSPLITTLQNVESRYPQMESRELDSILKLKSGQIMVIGGLLEDKMTTLDAGVPGVSEVPYFGNLFKSVDKTNTKKELVIMIRATIVDPQGYMDQTDRAVYEKFIQDPRPIQFPTP